MSVHYTGQQSTERVLAHALTMGEDLALLERIRSCLKRWATRYASSPHATEHVKETKLLIQEIEERLLLG